MTREESTSEHGEGASDTEWVQIPHEIQDLTLEELTENTNKSVPTTNSSRDGSNGESEAHGYSVRWDIAAYDTPQPGEGAHSEEDIFQDQNQYKFGYEMDSATSIGQRGKRSSDEERLQAINENRWYSDGELAIRESERDKQRITEALSGRLELTGYQRQEVCRIMEQLDLDRFGSQKRIETVALGVIRFVVNKDRLERNPGAMRITKDDQFQALMEELGVELSDLQTVKRVMVKELKKRQTGRRTVIVGLPGPDPNLPGPTPIEDLPDEYWADLPESFWDRPDDNWESVPEDVRAAIPSKYKDCLPDEYWVN